MKTCRLRINTSEGILPDVKMNKPFNHIRFRDVYNYVQQHIGVGTIVFGYIDQTYLNNKQ